MTVGGIVAACGDDARKKGIKVDFNSVPWKPPAADSMEWHRLARDHWPWLKNNKKKVKKCRANFNITYQNGEITAVSYDENGREINRYSLHTAGKETVLQVRPEEKTVKPEGLAFIQLQYTDSKGIWKPMEKHNIKVTVENGVLKGLGSPAPYVKWNYTDHTVATYYGEAMAVVQADGNGPVKVTVADEERFYVVEIPCE